MSGFVLQNLNTFVGGPSDFRRQPSVGHPKGHPKEGAALWDLRSFARFFEKSIGA